MRILIAFYTFTALKKKQKMIIIQFFFIIQMSINKKIYCLIIENFIKYLFQ